MAASPSNRLGGLGGNLKSIDPGRMSRNSEGFGSGKCHLGRPAPKSDSRCLSLTNFGYHGVMLSRSLPSSDYLRALLDYDSKTGLLTWKPRTGKWSSRWNKRHAGRLAGTLTSDGYVMIKIGHQNIAAHRAIWAMLSGTWPSMVRHSNGDPADNRKANLRGHRPFYIA